MSFGNLLSRNVLTTFFETVLTMSYCGQRYQKHKNAFGINNVYCFVSHSIDLCQEEGGCSIELIPNGRDMDVTAANVYDYVRKYAECRMFKCQRKALEVKKHTSTLFLRCR